MYVNNLTSCYSNKSIGSNRQYVIIANTHRFVLTATSDVFDREAEIRRRYTPEETHRFCQTDLDSHWDGKRFRVPRQFAEEFDTN